MGIERNCPYCRETIHPEAIKCRHCGEFLSGGSPPANPAAKDAEHLRLLSIFHYVLAGIKALFACIPIIHLLIGVVMIGASVSGSGSRGAPPAAVGIIFVLFASVMIGLGWGYAICLFKAGQFIARRQRYKFCLILAGVSCIFFPFGTALGVCTLVLLTRPTVKTLFGEA